MQKGVFYVLAGLLVTSLGFSTFAAADSKEQIHSNTQRAVAWLQDGHRDLRKLYRRSQGVLVFPDVVQMGFGLGGEFAEGVLLIDGKAAGYYASAGKAAAPGPDVHYKAEAIFFMTKDALQQFQAHRSWKVGRQSPVKVVNSTEDVVSALRGKVAHVGLVFSEGGLLTGAGLTGDKITKIVR